MRQKDSQREMCWAFCVDIWFGYHVFGKVLVIAPNGSLSLLSTGKHYIHLESLWMIQDDDDDDCYYCYNYFCSVLRSWVVIW